jgi:hypothetical protein
MTGNFIVNLNFSGAVVPEIKIFFKNLPIKSACKNDFPSCGSNRAPRTMHNFKNFILHYIRKLLYRLELFWLNSYSKEDFKRLSVADPGISEGGGGSRRQGVWGLP